jgi:hypothetical protein
MARPPVEWPIPAYILEYRERILVTYRVPMRRLGAAIAAPVVPETVQGHGLVTLCLSNGRCLKSVGGIPVLATEFRIAEVTTPVRWQAACRPALKGLYTVRLATNSHGLSRLARTALGLDAEMTASCPRATTPRVLPELEWPSHSVFAGAEEAEAQLLHPEWYFAPDRDGRHVRAVPVHYYARATTQFQPAALGAEFVAETLRCDLSELSLDHATLQKRCTHTYHFPPETIVCSRPATPARPTWVQPRGLPLLAA